MLKTNDSYMYEEEELVRKHVLLLMSEKSNRVPVDCTCGSRISKKYNVYQIELDLARACSRSFRPLALTSSSALAP